jgi:hypothetical protein
MKKAIKIALIAIIFLTALFWIAIVTNPDFAVQFGLASGPGKPDAIDNIQPNEQDVVVDDDLISEPTKDMSEIPGGTRFIIEICDRAEEEQIDCAEAEELFYEDETNRYYFNVIKSHYIIVIYNNGNSEDIVTALNTERATIADLDAFGIEYHTEPKQ